SVFHRTDRHYELSTAPPVALMTPEAVHYGRAEQLQAIRSQALQDAYQLHPERFVKGLPKPWPLPTAAWINPPTIQNDTEER
ncbi:MAG: hypothetical protein WD645_03150, partial [Dehalococcoidia bacterium]